MNALHITNIIMNNIVRILMTVGITLVAVKFNNFWLLGLYLIPGCMMANTITTKPDEKGKEGEKNDESKKDGKTR